MYTKVAAQKLEWDLLAAERYGYGLGVKLVRGAYMVQERKASSGLSNLISAENSLNLNMKIFICIAGRGSWIS
jgi:hypothetical protein